MTRCAQYSSRPRLSHWAAVKRIMRYIRGTISHGITFYGGASDLKLTGFIDADYCNDVNDRKSRTGAVFKLANGPISWFSQKQGCTADLTTEAEFVALAERTKEAIWLRRLSRSIGLPQTDPTILFCDNQSAIRLVKNPDFSLRIFH